MLVDKRFIRLLFCLFTLLSFSSIASQLPAHIAEQIIDKAQNNLGAEYFSIGLKHQQLPNQFSACADMQYFARKRIDVGRQYIKFIGCGISRQIAITVTAQIKVPVANATIEKNIVITNNHFSINTINIDKRVKFFVPIDAVIGRTTKRQIRQDKVISENQLKTEYLVEKGNLVNFIVSQYGFVVSTEMMARENGLLGQKIKIQHPISKRRIAGIVTGVNQVSSMPTPQIDPVIVIEDNKHNIRKDNSH